MNRRQFLGTVSAGLIASPALSSVQPKGLPVRVLGRTGIQVPILGFGSGSRYLMFYEARDQKVTRAIGITCHADPVALKTALQRHDFDCTQMALNAGLASMTDAMKIVPAGAASFEQLALPVATRKHMGVIAMKVFGQEQLIGAAAAEKLLAYALSLPVSLASVGMPQLDLVERNAALARAFRPMSRGERNRLVDSIEERRRHVMRQFLRDHEDV